MKVLICASGELGYKTLEKIYTDISIVAILTDHESLKIIELAKGKNIQVFIGNPRKRNFFENVMRLGAIDVLLSINYLFLLEKSFIEIPKLYPLNIHGSLLPKYRGRAPHIWAIINGETSIGITIHRIDEGCDTGDIVLQKIIELDENTTGGDILNIFEVEYPVLILEVLKSIEGKMISFYKQDHSLATFYEKRQPSDGEIDWNWNYTRILNWVRALTAPYPGAFTFFNGKKIYIWKIEASELKIEEVWKNGEIIKIENEGIYIKVVDNVLKVSQFTKSDSVTLCIGDLLQGEKVN